MRGFVLLTLITAGCGAKSTCVPGQSTACVCSDGTGGAQVCRGDGTFAACQCASGATSPGGDDMGTGGVGGNGNGSSGGDMAVASRGQKRVFVTSTAYTGSVAAGVCNNVAQSVNLGGTWVPWLSRTGSTSADAIDVVTGNGPWVRLDGMVAFANHAQLATAPSVPLAITEKNAPLPAGDDEVWTGTLTGGMHSGSDCGGWTANSLSASYGLVSTSEWTAQGSTTSCSYALHVYCFEQ
jgi:hypothetical protein